MLVAIIIAVIKVLVLFSVLMLMVAYGTLAERKVSGHIQDRLGPLYCGPRGLLQPFADGLKLFFKEDIVASSSDKVLYFLAPAIAIVPAILAIGVIPFGESVTLFGHKINLVVTDINVALLYLLAVSSFSVYAIVFGGWSANSKYPLLGGLRSAAQFISYELILGLSIMGVIMIVGSFSLVDIVHYQSKMWMALYQPLAFVIYMIAATAELNRLPFDLPEAESELVGGYHTEYSSMKFAMFFLGEYANMVVTSAVAVCLFLGGWYSPVSFLNWVPGPAWFLIKVVMVFFFWLWIRWTYPRFRYDQLMGFSWKFLLPLALLNIVATGGVMLFFQGGV